MNPPQSYTDLREMKQIEGAGALQDFEHETLHHYEPWITRAAAVEIPDKLDRRELLLMFDRSKLDSWKMEESDKCRIGIIALNPSNGPDNDWIATIVQNLPDMSDHHILVLASQRLSDGKGLGKDACKLSGVLPSTATATAEQVRAIAEGRRPFEIKVRKESNHHAISAKIDTLQNVCYRASGGQGPGDAFGCIVKEVVLGGRTQTLPTTDILGSLKLHSLRIAALAEKIGNAPVEALRSARGRVIVIDSPAGTGKTTLVRELVAACLQERLCASSDGPVCRQGTRLLAVTPTNEHGCRLTDNFYKRLVLEHQNALVLRLRSKDTDLTYVAKQAGEVALWECRSSESSSREITFSAGLGSKAGPVPKQHDAIHLLRVASMSTGKVLPKWVQPALIDRIRARLPATVVNINKAKDRLYNAVQLSKALELRKSEQDDAINLAVIAKKKSEAAANIRSARSAYENAIKTAYPRLLNIADVIVATPVTTMSSDLYKNFSPDLILLDEATRTDAIESLFWALYPNPVGVILIGDMMQLSAEGQSEPWFNNFALQSRTSLMCRLVLNGWPSLKLKIQRRCCPALTRFLDDFAWQDDDICVPSTTEDGVIADAFPPAGPQDAVLLVNVEGSEELPPRPGSKTRAYRKTGDAVWQCIDRLVRSGVKPVNIGVVTPYTGQRELHIAERNHRAQAGDVEIKGLRVGTISGFQGSECAVILLDLPNTKSVTYINDLRRLMTGASRAISGLIIVADRTRTLTIDRAGNLLEFFWTAEKHGRTIHFGKQGVLIDRNGTILN